MDKAKLRTGATAFVGALRDFARGIDAASAIRHGAPVRTGAVSVTTHAD